VTNYEDKKIVETHYNEHKIVWEGIAQSTDIRGEWHDYKVRVVVFGDEAPKVLWAIRTDDCWEMVSPSSSLRRRAIIKALSSLPGGIEIPDASGQPA